MAEKMKTVAIIGGGVSGLLACDVLKKMNFSPKVFEKQHNIGGIWELTQYEGVTLQNCCTFVMRKSCPNQNQILVQIQFLYCWSTAGVNLLWRYLTLANSQCVYEPTVFA
jgi:heterodisulfide reductase subunit A-like polyferredoxin